MTVPFKAINLWLSSLRRKDTDDYWDNNFAFYWGIERGMAEIKMEWWYTNEEVKARILSRLEREK